MLKVWNLSLIVATFALTVLGTFLTRGSILSSVHTFAQSLVGPLYLDALHDALGGQSSRRVVEVVLPDGEVHKTLESISRILDVLVTNRLGRDATVVALGGGVVGDMAGFAAACYQRGVDFVQVPTTLLAQVDSSVGGKTGANHPGGKNLIGAFHQPRAVITDTRTLRTLPDRELRAGMAEVIKCALICDEPFFTWLEQNAARVLDRNPAALAHAIRRSCEIKAAIVGRAEREQGARALLNLGQTLARAATGAEVGLTLGYLAQKVVGQYDVALIGPTREPRLLFVAPNLSAAQQRLDVDRELFLSWIALHETTHAVQFAANGAMVRTR